MEFNFYQYYPRVEFFMIELSDILSNKNDDIISVPSRMPMQEAARLLTDHEIGVVLVVEPDESVCGILSERDVAVGVARFGGEVADKTVADLMTAPVISCSSFDSMVEILVLMEEHHVRHLPVIDDGALVGMLSMRDIQAAWLDALDQECESLRGVKAA